MAGRPLSVSDRELLSVFKESELPFLTAEDVSDQVNLGQRHARDRLMTLVEEGQLKTRTVGSRARVWWLPQQSMSTSVSKTHNKAGNTAMSRATQHEDRALLDGSLDDVYFCNGKDTAGKPVVTFNNLILPTMQPTKVMLQRPETRYGWGTDHDSPIDAVGDRLIDVAGLLRDPSKAAFGIRNGTGYWFGYGIGNFYAALEQTAERYEAQKDALGRTTHSEGAFLQGKLANEDGLISIAFQPNVSSFGTSYLNVGLVTDGVPMDTHEYQQLAEAFNSRLEPARTLEDYHRLTSEPNLKVHRDDIVEKITAPRDYGEEDWVEKIVIKNPIDQGVINQLTEDKDIKEGEVASLQRATEIEHVIADIENTFASETHDYNIQRVNATIGMGVSGGFEAMDLSLCRGREITL